MIITQATGRQVYGEMAVNLCLALMLYCPGESLAVMSDGAFENAGGDRLPDVKIVRVSAANPFRNKVEINQHFSSGIYLDADTIVNGSVRAKPALDQIRSARVYLHHLEADIADRLKWDAPANLERHYGLKAPFAALNSSVIGWKANTKRFWNDARAAYGNRLGTVERIAGFYPDEIAFGVAASKAGIEAGERFVCFPWTRGNFRDFPFISFAGNNASDDFMRHYNVIANKARAHFGFTKTIIDRRKKLSYGR